MINMNFPISMCVSIYTLVICSLLCCCESVSRESEVFIYRSTMAGRRSGLGLMNCLRVHVDASSALNHQSPLRILPNFSLRRFSEEVRRTFLDKLEVTDRVISCVNFFDNVDTSKVFTSILNLISSSIFTYFANFYFQYLGHI